MLLCEIKNTKIGGIIMITVIAIAEPDLAIPPAEIEAAAEVRVLSYSLKIVPAELSDHKSLNAKSPNVSHAGFTSGTAI